MSKDIARTETGNMSGCLSAEYFTLLYTAFQTYLRSILNDSNLFYCTHFCYVKWREEEVAKFFFAIFFRVPTRHLTFCVADREKFLLCKLLWIFHHNESAISESFVKNCGRELSRYICGKTRKWNRCWGWNQTAELYSCCSTRFMPLAVILSQSRLLMCVFIWLLKSLCPPSDCPSVGRKQFLDYLCTNISLRLFNGAFYVNLSWRKKKQPVTPPVYLPEIPHGMVWSRTRTSTVNAHLTNCSNHWSARSYYL